MAYTKESIQSIVRESIDVIVESLSDNIYKKFCQATNNNNQTNLSALMIDINKLPIPEQKILVAHADDKGILNVVEIKGERIIEKVLEISASNGYLDIVKFLVETGAKINGTGALINSANNGHLEVVKFLVEKGAIDLRTALHASAVNNHLEVVKFLVEKGAEVNNLYALNDSAIRGHLNVIKFLVESGADVSEASLLYISIKRGNIELVKFLVSKYAELKMPIPDKYITKEETDINKFLFMHIGEDKHGLFSDNIVSKLTPIKKLFK